MNATTEEKMIVTLKTKVAVWNRWRKLSPSNPNISDTDLRGANLRGADLSGANLRYADLSCADLSCADLRGAILSYADLRGANLSCANLRGADLRGANLSGANLSHTNLRGADLSDTDLSGADLRGANLRGANLRGADLRYTILSGADLDFSCLDLSCKSLSALFDEKHLIQFLYHVAIPTQNNSLNIKDKDLKKLLNMKSFQKVVNKFHRVEECGTFTGNKKEGFVVMTANSIE